MMAMMDLLPLTLALRFNVQSFTGATGRGGEPVMLVGARYTEPNEEGSGGPSGVGSSGHNYAGPVDVGSWGGGYTGPLDVGSWGGDYTGPLDVGSWGGDYTGPLDVGSWGEDYDGPHEAGSSGRDYGGPLEEEKGSLNPLTDKYTLFLSGSLSSLSVPDIENNSILYDYSAVMVEDVPIARFHKLFEMCYTPAAPGCVRRCDFSR